MKNSAQRIRTSHVGRLPIPSGFEETAFRLARGEVGGEEVAEQVVPAVADVVKRQVEIGLDCIGDGEYWSALDIRWFDQQMTGLGTGPLKPGRSAACANRRASATSSVPSMPTWTASAPSPAYRASGRARRRASASSPTGRSSREAPPRRNASSTGSRRRSRAPASPWTRLLSPHSRRDGSTISSITSITGPTRNSSTRSPTPWVKMPFPSLPTPPIGAVCIKPRSLRPRSSTSHARRLASGPLGENNSSGTTELWHSNKGKNAMDLGLQDKHAIVTGGSRGIGKAIARELAREGADVAIVARNEADLEATARELATETNRRIVPLAADVTSK